MGKDVRTLVISDDESTRESAKALEEFGETAVAKEGLPGVLLAREQLVEADPFDLIFIDLANGPINGQFALELIKGLEEVHHPRSKSKVIVAAAASQREAIFAAARQGADYCLRKPFQRERLRLKAAELLDIRVRPMMPVIRGADVGVFAETGSVRP